MNPVPKSENGPRAGAPAMRLHAGVVVGAAAVALMFQVALPAYLPFADLLDFPLVVLVYLALLQKGPLAGMGLGLAIGLAQDGLTHGPIGVFGIIKSVVGYASSSVSSVMEVDYGGARSILTAFFFLIHQVLFWVVKGPLLGSEVVFDVPRTLILATVHAGLALLLFRSLDPLRRSS